MYIELFDVFQMVVYYNSFRVEWFIQFDIGLATI